MIKIKNLFSVNLIKGLMNLWCYKWLTKYQSNPKTLKLLVFFETIILVFTWFVSIPIILTMYLGVLLYRHRIFQKIHSKIAFEFQSKFHSKIHTLKGILLVILYLFILSMIILMIFTIPFIILMIIGYKLEKKRNNPKLNKNKKFVIQYNDNEKNKQESKTIEYLND